ncbi:MAG: hypothetical protein C0631_10740 [Sedimenticola sp.]|jgi:two-component system osmolarity sensor histidine kinase EnvZ|nr:MAG: hypothetical protein C0631_10740 [Sedimenticola sp.]
MASSSLLVLITLGTLAYYVLIPVGKQAADDLAALLMLSAQTWVELPPETRPDLEHELFTRHRLKLFSGTPLSPLSDPGYPYLTILHQGIEQRTGHPVSVGSLPDHESWLWVDIPIAEETLRFGFPLERIGARPPMALITITVAILLLALVTALTLALRISRPLATLSAATTAVGRGEKQLSLAENGPDELATLARNFNRMSAEVAALIENRTTLLAGVSHDLRTPLTRINLALELLPDGLDEELYTGLTKDVEEMDHLLNEVLMLARGVGQREPPQEVELGQVVSGVVNSCVQGDAVINWTPEITVWWPLPLEVFKRVLGNLLVNALRYGEGQPVTIELSETGEGPVIRVLDRGAGIPPGMEEAVFQPFFRLENSRNPDTGGSGLGLAIVAQLCAAQGWRIRLLERPGGGVEARLTLSGGSL